MPRPFLPTPSPRTTLTYLGIDPGTHITGYGCLVPHGPLSARIVEAGVFRLKSSADLSDRIHELHDDLCGLLERVRPDVVAVEQIHTRVEYPSTAIIMGHARGVVLLCARRAGIPLVELQPSEVKKAITGSGRAKKDQVQRAVQQQFGMPALPEPPDLADALAIAWCALRRADRPLATR